MAIRSNTNAARAAIREYIADTLVLRSDEFSRFDASGTIEEACSAYVGYLDRIFANDHLLKTAADRIANDLDGGGAWEICTYERAKLVGAWLQETDAEIDEWYERGKADEMFRRLIIREIITLARR